MEKIECGNFGFFEYKRPNIPEAIDLISKIYPSQIDVDVDIVNSITSKCISNMGNLVKKVELKINDKDVRNYSDMIEEYDLIKYIMEMAADVMGCLELSVKKKNGSETQLPSLPVE